jgi:CHAD domain-containing protein
MPNKWEIKELDINASFSDSAKIILYNRLNNLLESINLFFKEETVENLHDVRIALRRLRYNMELFIDCFDKKKFSTFYKKVKQLQDLSGLLRDLDVLIMNINVLITKDKINISNKVFKKIDEKRTGLKVNIKLELMKFTHSKAFKNFSSYLS